jgi:hypothetical protein
VEWLAQGVGPEFKPQYHKNKKIKNKKKKERGRERETHTHTHRGRRIMNSRPAWVT